jgi:hypothetical protein
VREVRAELQVKNIWLVASHGELRPAFQNRQVFRVNGNRLLLWQRWAIVVGTVGAVLRLVQFFSCRSLWYDEALLALNVLHRSFKGLFQPLDYHQGAPVGFLLLEMLSTQLAGKGELALRTIPLLAGIASLFVALCLL